MLPQGLFHAIAYLLTATFDLIRIIDLILDHLLMIPFTLDLCTFFILFFLLFAHFFPYARCQPRQLSTHCYTILLGYVFGLLLIVQEEAGDWSLRSMRVILAVCSLDLSLANTLDLRANGRDIGLITISLTLQTASLNLVLFEPL